MTKKEEHEIDYEAGYCRNCHQPAKPTGLSNGKLVYSHIDTTKSK